jgi:hypothetical protein
MDYIEQLLAADPFNLKSFIKAVDELENRELAIVQYKPLLQKKWLLLQKEPAELSRKKQEHWKQNRGYEFERVLFALFALEKLLPSPPFKAKSEQVDGLFEFHQRHFLVEAKWEKDPLPASSVYSFRGKLEGRLIGTLGVFIAVNGFSANASDALLYGGAVNVILFNGEDIDYALQPDYSFSQVLQIKLRRAARFRDVFYTFERFLDERRVYNLRGW